MKRLIALISFACLLACSARVDPTLADEKGGTAKESDGNRPKRVEKTNAEWAKILPRESFLVTRMKATEPAGTGKYARYHGKGIFACICCGTELFDARTKFESGTGWPSFYKAISNDRIVTQEDHGDPSELRIEVMCATCDAHLGHVFQDGPPPTGLRFCMNSAALKLVGTPVNEKAKTVPKGKTVKVGGTTSDKGAAGKAKSM
ncbi:MAG: msrB 1 [Planctomycetota bacterium]|nr:msrB 1 [Planctomycetota bacterium]